MAGTSYIDSTCKSAVNRVTGMPFKWSLNPYRGCVHACHYCYARETHTFLGLDADGDFERQIFVKGNIAAVLDRELSRTSWAGESIAIGTATDAYQPAEKRFRLTRACLDVLLRHRNPFSVVTKSSLIVRDLGLIEAIAAVAAVRIYFTVTTMDESLSDRIEPGAFPPSVRLAALKTLADAGIHCGVLMAPIMPGINDSGECIDRVTEAAAAAGAKSVYAGSLRLASPVKDHFYGFLQHEFPDLLPWYLRNMDGQHLPKAAQERIAERANDARSRFGLERDDARTAPNPAAARVLAFQQLGLSLLELPASLPAMNAYDPLSA